ncbi:MAG: hypothetical protein LBD64_01560 [Odoribacteraceae bacterium]|nr:hypothetical protein [Odoribacteraceae bacterium]
MKGDYLYTGSTRDHFHYPRAGVEDGALFPALPVAPRVGTLASRPAHPALQVDPLASHTATPSPVQVEYHVSRTVRLFSSSPLLPRPMS